MKHFSRLKQWVIAIAVLAAPLAMQAQDVGVTSIVSPANGDCPNSSGIAKVIIYNYGTTSVSSIPVSISVVGTSTTSATATYSKTLAPGKSDTVTFTGLNTSGGGRFKVTAATSLSNDANPKNDAIKATVNISFGSPKTITANDSSTCGPSYANIFIPKQKGVVTGWFTDKNYNTLSDTGNSRTEVVTSNKLFYAQSFGLVYDSTRMSSSTASTSYTRVYGYIFDAKAKLSSILDSIDVYLNTTNYDSLYIYYREGGSGGYERSSTDWTLLQSTYIKGNGSNAPVMVKVPATLLKAGKVYGFYFWSKGSNIGIANDGTSYQDSGVSRGLMIKQGEYVSSNARWGSYSFSSNYTANGDFYTRLFSPTCVSNRKQIFRRVKSGTSGVAYKQGTPFKGLFNAGTDQNPDNVCPLDTATYNLDPPTAYQNSDFGTKWYVTGVKVYSSGGQLVSDTLTSRPTSTKSYSLRIIPPTKFQDSTLIIAITVISADTCMNTYIRKLQVGQLPKANFTFQPACQNQETTLQDSSVVVGGGLYSRIWDLGDGSSAAASIVSHTYKTAGTYNVKLKVITAGGCTDTKVKAVTVYAKPKTNFTTTPLCAGTDVTLRDTTVTAGKVISHAWLLPGTSRWDTSSQVTIKNAKAIKYSIRYAVQVSTGCIDTITKVITVGTPPSPRIVFRSACLYETVYFKDTAKADQGGTYFWDFGDQSTSTLDSPSHIYFASGSYTVKLSVLLPATGCTSTATITASPFPFPKAYFTFKPVCAGGTVSFADSSDYAGSIQRSISWDFGDGSAILSGKGTPSHLYAKAGTYQVKLVISNNNGCADSTVKSVTVYPLPQPDFSATSVCVGSPMSFTNKTPGTANFLWDFGDTTTSAERSPEHAYLRAGTYTVKLTATGTGGCVNSTSQTVTVTPGPDASWHYSKIGRKVTFTAGTSGLTSYKWVFTDLNDSITTTTPTTSKLYASTTGQHSICLTVTDASGCSTTNCRTIDLSVGIHSQDENEYSVKVYPNPFTGVTHLTYTLDKRSVTKVTLQDLNGREVQVVKAAGMETEGQHDVSVDANNLASGVYLLKVIVGDQVYNERIEKLK
jgi:PKD repeat protein